MTRPAVSYEVTRFERAACVYRRFNGVVAFVFWMSLVSLPIFWSFHQPPLTYAAASVFVLVLLSMVASGVGSVRVGGKLQLAVANNDIAQTRRLSRIIHGDPTSGNLLGRYAEAYVLIVDEKYDEARDLYAAMLKRQRLRPAFRRLLVNNLAIATSLAGDPKTGIQLARQAVELAKKRPPRNQRELDIFFGTLGIALSLGGEHEEAIDYLSQVTKRAGEPDHQAMRGYFLGTSLFALKRNDEALVALGEASRQTGKWAERARIAHAKALAQPHRA